MNAWSAVATRFTLRLRPTASLLGLLFVLAAMWYAASSQNNAPAYLLLFALTSVAIISIPGALKNLSGLTAKIESVAPVFSGQEITVPLELHNRRMSVRYGITAGLATGEAEPEQIDAIEAGRAERVTLRLPTSQRGEHELGPICLTSPYPLGFFCAEKKIATSQWYVVYPRPAGDSRLPSSHSHSAQAVLPSQPTEADEFAGARPYIPGESQRHIDWKAVARGQPLMTKQFATEQGGTLYLDFDRMGAAEKEARLSQLALWVIEAQRAGRAYGLRLPGTEIRPGLGEAHFHRCLKELALFR